MTTACIGECMVELAPAGGGLFRQAFAGDVFNTAWYLKALSGAPVRFVTAIGTDPLSDAMGTFIAGQGIDTGHIARLPDATVGLYLITLTGTERSFTYWRGQSAARRLADDPARLAAALDGASLAYLSGITLAILSPEARRRLLDVLEQFRRQGGKIAFDPNIRPALWPMRAEMDAALAAATALADIALPSFDDEAALYGDPTPRDTVRRLTAWGAREIVVKNGPAPTLVWADGKTTELPAPTVPDARDTTGAGDSFNAGYLNARLRGADAPTAVRAGQSLAAEVIRHPGALIPPEALARFR
jgi:2-dehydro-3-deoxygluconokinase